MNTVAIIQARMGSSRLPAKVFMDISGKPMLLHVIERLRHSALITAITVATTINKQDDVIGDLCRKHDVGCYRGSETDVLDRYYRAAKFWKAESVVRICSDCPLIDPTLTDRVIGVYKENRKKYVGASTIIKRTFPRGLDAEVFSFSVLEEVWRNSDKTYQREHVTPYIYEHPQAFAMASIESESDLSYLRWTVDTEEDLCFIRQVYERLYKEDRLFLTNDVLELLAQEPALQEINSHIQQKPVR